MSAKQVNTHSIFFPPLFFYLIKHLFKKPSFSCPGTQLCYASWERSSRMELTQFPCRNPMEQYWCFKKKNCISLPYVHTCSVGQGVHWGKNIQLSPVDCWSSRFPTDSFESPATPPPRHPTTASSSCYTPQFLFFFLYVVCRQQAKNVLSHRARQQINWGRVLLWSGRRYLMVEIFEPNQQLIN